MSAAGGRVADELAKKITQSLDRLGLLFRVFYRCKSDDSIRTKIRQKGYTAAGRRLEDFIGIRVALYFTDDIAIVVKVLDDLFESKSTSIDRPDAVTFQPTRINLVYSLPKESREKLNLAAVPEVAPTFEVQVRTVLSEGWHEVEHDLRYKCKEDWDTHPDLSRTLNGVVATLETAEWSMLQLFEELAYRHYKDRRWGPMLRVSLRLRCGSVPMSDQIVDLLDKDQELAKRVFRTKRSDILEAIIRYNLDFPITLDNIVFLINALRIKSPDIFELCPESIALQFDLVSQSGNGNSVTKNKNE